jgi:hypothetical protein
MLDQIIGILEGLAGLLFGLTGVVLGTLLDWITSLAGLPAQIPAPILAALHSAAVLVDAIMPPSYFATGLGILGSLWLAWVAWKILMVVIHWGSRLLDWALSTGGVIVDAGVAAVGSALSGLLALLGL